MKARPRRLERAFWNLHSRNWDDLLEDPESARHVSEIAELLLAAAEEGAVVADLGCGTGNHAIAMARAGLRVVGVDFTVAMLERAAAKGNTGSTPLCLVQADLGDQLPFADASLDGAISVYSIQFLEPARFLREVRRVLKVGAAAVIEAPRHDPVPRDLRSLSVRYRTFRRLKNVAAAAGERLGLVRVFDPDELASTARAAGFSVTELHDTRHSVILQLRA